MANKKSLYEAYSVGFYEGISTMMAVFKIPKEEIKEKLHSIGLINSRISELYHIWMELV